jgi:hypothetical protein
MPSLPNGKGTSNSAADAIPVTAIFAAASRYANLARIALSPLSLHPL